MFTCCTIILRCSNEFCYILRVGYKRRSARCLRNTLHLESEEDTSSQKSEISFESAEESWAVAYKELSYSQSSSSSSIMSSFFQDGMQEPFQELVSLSLTSLSLYFIALNQLRIYFQLEKLAKSALNGWIFVILRQLMILPKFYVLNVALFLSSAHPDGQHCRQSFPLGQILFPQKCVSREVPNIARNFSTWTTGNGTRKLCHRKSTRTQCSVV